METKQKPKRKPAIANKPILKWQPSHYVTIEEFAEQHNVTADKMAFYQICTEDGGRGERVYVRRNQVVTEQMRKVGRPKKK